MQCTAQSKQAHRQCKRHTEPGRSVCYYHGGRTPIGRDSVHATRGGRYSKALPARLLDRYQDAIADPNLLILREDIALLDTRLAELTSKLDSGDAPARLTHALNLLRAHDHAMARMHRTTAQNSVPEESDQGARHGTAHNAEATELAALRTLRDELTRALTGAQDDTPTWLAIQSALQERRQLVESERKRLVELSQMISAEQLLVLLDRTVDIVRRHVPDRASMLAISNEMAALAHVPERGR